MWNEKMLFKNLLYIHTRKYYTDSKMNDVDPWCWHRKILRLYYPIFFPFYNLNYNWLLFKCAIWWVLTCVYTGETITTIKLVNTYISNQIFLVSLCNLSTFHSILICIFYKQNHTGCLFCLDSFTHHDYSEIHPYCCMYQ